MTRLIDLLARGETYIKWNNNIWFFRKYSVEVWLNNQWVDHGYQFTISELQDLAEPTTDPSIKKVKKWKWAWRTTQELSQVTVSHMTEWQMKGIEAVKLPWTEIEVPE